MCLGQGATGEWGAGLVVEGGMGQVGGGGQDGRRKRAGRATKIKRCKFRKPSINFWSRAEQEYPRFSAT